MAPIKKKWTPVINIRQLPKHSRWRKYKKGLKELVEMGAKIEEINSFRNQAARFCFLAFADLMLKGDLQVAPFHELIGSAFEDIANGQTQRFILSCPPRSGKSLLSQLLVAWLIGKDPTTQHVIACYFDTLSKKFFRKTIAYLNQPNFKEVFPNWPGFKTNSKYEMVSDGYLLPTSVGGGLTGFMAGSPSPDSEGVGAMVIDDPLKNSFEGKTLAKLRDWWGEEASTRKTNRWAQVLIGTRFHVNDLHGILMETDGLWDAETNSDGWRWLNIAGLCEDPDNDPLNRKIGQSHWPEYPVFTVSSLTSMKKSLGSNKFAALYQGLPVASEGSILKSKWLKIIEPEEAPNFTMTYLAIDTAFKEKQEADESVIAVMGYSHHNPSDIYLRHLVHGHWTFPDLISIVKATHQEWGSRFLCIEEAASGHSLIQVLERDTQIHLHCFKPTNSKTVRLQTVAPLFESGNVKIIRGNWTDSFIKELVTFPHSPHDDKVDAVVWGLHYFLLNFSPINKKCLSTIQMSRQLKKRTMEGFTEVTSTNNRSWRKEIFAGYSMD